jgi:hypothetical protein
MNETMASVVRGAAKRTGLVVAGYALSEGDRTLDGVVAATSYPEPGVTRVLFASGVVREYAAPSAWAYGVLGQLAAPKQPGLFGGAA